MLRGLLSMFLLGRVFRMFSGRRGSHPMHRRTHGHGWGSGSYAGGVGNLMGLGRRRRSFI